MPHPTTRSRSGWCRNNRRRKTWRVGRNLASSRTGRANRRPESANGLQSAGAYPAATTACARAQRIDRLLEPARRPPQRAGQTNGQTSDVPHRPRRPRPPARRIRPTHLSPTRHTQPSTLNPAQKKVPGANPDSCGKRLLALHSPGGSLTIRSDASSQRFRPSSGTSPPPGATTMPVIRASSGAPDGNLQPTTPCP